MHRKKIYTLFLSSTVFFNIYVRHVIFTTIKKWVPMIFFLFFLFFFLLCIRSGKKLQSKWFFPHEDLQSTIAWAIARTSKNLEKFVLSKVMSIHPHTFLYGSYYKGSTLQMMSSGISRCISFSLIFTSKMRDFLGGR